MINIDLKKFNLSYFLILLIIIYPIIFDLGLYQVNRVSPFVFLFIYLLTYKITIKLTSIKLSFAILSFSLLLLSLLNPSDFFYKSSNVIVESLRMPIYFSIFTFYVLLSNISDRTVYNIGKIIYVFGLLISIYIICVKIYPEFYFNYILPFLIGASKNAVISLMKEGYGLMIGSSPIYGDYIINIAIFVGLAFYKKANNKKIKLFFFLSILVLTIATFFEGRKGELLCSVLSIIIVELVCMNIFKIKDIFNILKKISAYILIFIIIVFFLLQTNNLTRFIMVFDRISSGEDMNSVSTGRFYLWCVGVEKFFESPLFGNGWCSFPYFVESETGIRNNFTHNEYLEFLSEVGIIGTIFICMPLFYVYKKIIVNLKRIHSMNYNCKLPIIISSYMSFGIVNFFILLSFIEPCLHKYLSSCILAIGFIFADYTNNNINTSNN